jgi:hypothetical protein
MPNISIDVSAGIPLWAKVTTKGGLCRSNSGRRIVAGALWNRALLNRAKLHSGHDPLSFHAVRPVPTLCRHRDAPVFSLKQRSAFNTGVTVDPTAGLVLQAGADIVVDRHWGWSFDVKKLFANGEGHSAGVDYRF